MSRYGYINDSELGPGINFMPQSTFGGNISGPEASSPVVQQVIRNPVLLKAVMNYAAMQGRGGDTMLVHLRPDEYQRLVDQGGSGTVNPITGLPEAGFFSSVFKSISRIFSSPVFKTVTSVLAAAASLATGNPIGAMLALGSNIPGPVGQISSIASMASGLSNMAGFGSVDKLAGTANSFSGARESVAQALGYAPIVDPASTTYISAADQLGRVASGVQTGLGVSQLVGGAATAASGNVGGGLQQATTGAGNLLGSMGSSASSQSQAPSSQQSGSRTGTSYGITNGGADGSGGDGGAGGKPFGQATGRFGSYANSNYKFG